MHIPKAPGFSSMLKDGARVSKKCNAQQFSLNLFAFMSFFCQKLVTHVIDFSCRRSVD